MSIITLTGNLGSGKSTVGALLAKRLNFEYVNGSKIFRELSEELNLDIIEINNKAEELNLDEKTDNFLISLNNKDNLVIDSRLAWHFVNKSFKVYLCADLSVATERIFESNRTTEGNIKNFSTLRENLKSRRKIEINRFKKLYNVDIQDANNYDLIINTDHLTPTEVMEDIINSYGLAYEY